MRVSSLVKAAVVAAALVSPQAASAGWWHNQEALEIRVGPGIAYAKLVLVPRHQRLRVYQCTAWCDVTWGTYHGYVQTRYVVSGCAQFADHLTVSPVTRHGYTYLTPVYVPPAPAYLTSEVLSPWDGYGAQPVGRIWYYQGRWLDRPDYFYDVRR
jgi:uncharacterized protein YraI